MVILVFVVLLFTLCIGVRFFPKWTFKIISVFANPIARIYIRKRISNGLETKKRSKERLGKPSCKRPKGNLIWFHAVSVGETNSFIPFIQKFKEISPDTNILLTTTTKTAADIAEQRLKDVAIHQFAPFDIITWVKRFVKYWNPKAVFFVESEVWPNILCHLHEKGIPIYLLNARFSDRTIKRMLFVKKYFNILPLKLYQEIFISSCSLKETFQNLGAKNITVIPNMKIISPKLPVIKKEERKLRKLWGARKTWLAVSVHKSEIEIVIKILKKVKDSDKNILAVIALRHPDIAEEAKALFETAGLSVALHTEDRPEKELDSDVYILNKIGCLGEFFSTIDTVLVCGSLVPGIGGHNFIEPVNFLCATATGQYIDNFKDIYPYFEKLCKKLENENEIAEFIIDSVNSYKRPEELEYRLNYSEKWIEIIERISRFIKLKDASR